MKVVPHRNFYSRLDESAFLIRARSETPGLVGNHWQDCFGHLVVGTFKVPERNHHFLFMFKQGGISSLGTHIYLQRGKLYE